MLAGRTAERDRLVRLLTDASAGHGAALVVTGIAGVGKSALLDDVVGHCGALEPAVHVLRTAGVESESPLAFAALQRLLRPAMPLVDRLPDPQTRALRIAFGESEGTSDRFLVFLASLSLLSELATEHPVLVVVDDAHWLDDASAAALQFIARRIESERLALAFVTREGDVRTFDPGDLPLLRIEGLGLQDAAELLAAHVSGPVAPAVAERLHGLTGGNPLALVEVAGALGPAAMSGNEPLPAVLPLTDGVESAFLTRYRALPDASRTWLLVAAADDSARESDVAAAAAHLGVTADAVPEVEASDLARVRNGWITLRHPLVRSSVYGAATSGERRQVHRALADALLVSGDHDRRAWHLAASVDQPDAEVVAALDQVAERASSRGGHEAAAAAWTRAAELTVDGEELGVRLSKAATAAWLAARPGQATGLATAAAAEPVPRQVRVGLLTLQGQIAWNTRSLDEGYDLVLQAAELAAEVDPATAARLAMLSSSLAAFGARSARDYDPVAAVAEPAPDAPLESRQAYQLLRGFGDLARLDHPAAAAWFRAAFELAEQSGIVDDHILAPNLAIAAWLIDDDARNQRMHERQLTAARQAGALTMVEHALTRGFNAQLPVGAWSRAAAGAAEALSLTSGTGRPGWTALPLAELALVAALRGQDDVDARLAEVAGIVDTYPVGLTEVLVVSLCQWARALRATGAPEVALRHFEQIGLPTVRRLATLDLFDVAARAGRPEVAATWLAEAEQFAAGVGTPAATAVVEHGRALLGDDGAAEEHFLASLAAHEGSPRIPDRARTHLAFGEHLRRARRRVDARVHLRAALALFEDLGATPWVERAAQELRASGESARRREAGAVEELTAGERQVAGLVRQGLSNRDVAAQLFVSPRTVDFHLRNVFRKLGVSSRGELIALVADV